MAQRTIAQPTHAGPVHIHGALSFTGMRFSGKTTIAKLVSERIGAQFFDTDALFVERYGVSITDYVAKSSLLGFRAAESVVIRKLFSRLPDVAVVSLGGGALANSESLHYMKINTRIVTRKGPVVYLTPSPDPEVSARILTERENQGGVDPNRPPLPEKTLETLIKRHPFYQGASNGFVVYESDKTGSKDEVISQRADEIIRKISVLLRA